MPPDGLRERNKQKMRTAISNAATRLFIKRGFDQVTVAEIAEAAGVSTMTVFNHFQKKEDLFFDRKGESIALIRTALTQRPENEAPVDVLARLSYAFLKKTQARQQELLAFWNAVDQSPSLRARAREMRDTAVENIAGALAEGARRSAPDIDAHLISLLFVAAWQTVLIESIRLSRQGASPAKTRRAVQPLLGRALKAVSCAAAATPYG
jgi:AcrR family transcriptional regulator